MIINFKIFNFPSFKKWSENEYKFDEVLGAYRCVVEASEFGMTSTKYKFAVALTNQNPTNIWTNTLFYEPFTHTVGDASGLEEWYNKTVERFNDFWQAYMNSTYAVSGVKLVVAVERNQLEQEIRTISVYDARKQRFWTEKEIHERGIEKFLSADDVKETLNWNLNGDSSKYQFKLCKPKRGTLTIKGRAFIFD